ncbi:MAG: hypothetical protein R2761_28310 [Acidimicrobiales bacterium]
MDARTHDTIDALLAELVPTTRLDNPVKDSGDAEPDPPAGPPGTDGSPTRRRRWPVRLALAVVALGLAAALVTAGVLIGRSTAGGEPAGGESADGADASQLGSAPGEPFGTASIHSEAGDAARTDPTGLVARYREELAARDLVSTSLGDDDLTRFGYAACVFAASADGPADFDRFRAAAVADADSSLTSAEMAVVIDTAVVVFCPVDAQRLGIAA